MRYLRAFLFLAVVCPIRLMAEAQPTDWVGEFTMNHDGHVGTLSIVDQRTNCQTPRWCSLSLSYRDSNGATIPARVANLDGTGQHLTFFLDFPGNTQRFDVYLFSWDKTKMAGTTFWQGRIFGVFATRVPVTAGSRPAVRAAESVSRAEVSRAGMYHAQATLPPATPGKCALTGKPTTVVTPTGAFELHYPDGAVHHGLGCGGGTTCPDGRIVQDSCTRMEAITPTAPSLPGDDTTKKWLEWHNQALMQVLSGLLGDDQNSINNYKANFEKGNVSLYQRIATKTDVISQLASSH